MGFDPKSVGDGIGDRVDFLLKLFQLGHQFLPAVVTGMIRHVFSYPLPEMFHWHEIRAVGRQRQQIDSQLVGPLNDRLCPMIGGAVPEYRQGRLGRLPAERFQQLQGSLAVGTVVRIELDLALIVKVDAVTGHFRTQLRGTGADPEPLTLDRPAIAFVGILAEMGFIDVYQAMLAPRGGDQQGVEFFQKRRALVRIRFI